MNVQTALLQAIDAQNKGKLNEATALFQKVLKADPSNIPALYSLCVININLGNSEQAINIAKRGIQLAPKYAPMYMGLAEGYKTAGEYDKAIENYDKAIELDPNFTQAYQNSGAILRAVKRHKDALLRFMKILEIEPTNLAAISNAAILLTEFKQAEAAINMYKRLVALQPDYEYAIGSLLYEQLHHCDWTGYDDLLKAVLVGVAQGKRACKTLGFMAMADNPELHLIAAKTFAEHHYPTKSVELYKGEKYDHDRIRVAYVSPDLREHPVGHLMVGIFEHHDKSKFEIYSYSLGINDSSRLRERIQKASDHFIDASVMSPISVAKLIREHEIDVVIDLAGYTSDAMPDIYSYRPAPAHVGFLGYPGTLGTKYVDYILADSVIIPVGHERYYTEKVVRMPNAYLPTDNTLPISERTPTREECGLPEEGKVLCSFSHDYKIQPYIFDIWMNILKKVDKSVLWLVSRSEMTQANLRKRFQENGLDPSRLIFAKRVPKIEDHLARYRLADVFLDTYPYNAHTTAADALWSGLPVVTMLGNSFASRVAASLNSAIGMPELIAKDLKEYEEIALKLVTDEEFNKVTKLKITKHKKHYPLFDTNRFCRDLEIKLELIYMDSKVQ